MTKSKPSLRSSAKRGLLLNLVILTLILSGCSSSTAPTYLKENIPQAIQDICKKEYKIDVRSRLAGNTLWVYFPVEDIFKPLGKADKPEKYIERFAIGQNKAVFENGILRLKYSIKAVPEQEKYQQEYQYNKSVLEKINDVILVVRRVLFSTERAKTADLKFLFIVTADIKNGFQIRQLSYYVDLKKVSYGLIGLGEYQHRAIQDIDIEPRSIGDKEGLYLDYEDIGWGDFISAQIQHRIKLKFGKPEAQKGTDIDKEVTRIVASTIQIYDFRDFSQAEFNDLATNNTFILNRQAILARSLEK
jgi:hypothetical protein